MLTVPVRWWYVMVAHPPLDHVYSDMVSYRDSALRFISPDYHQFIGDTLYPPGTAYGMGWLYQAAGNSWSLVVFSLFLGSCLIPVLVHAIAGRLFSRRIAAAALVLAAVHFPFLAFAGYVLSEIPFTVALLVTFWLLICAFQTERTWPRLGLALGAGFTLGATASIKSSIFAPALMVVLFLGWHAIRERAVRPFTVVMGMVGLGLMILVVPMAIRATALCQGDFCLISSNGDLNFHQGHSGRSGTFTMVEPTTKATYQFACPASLQKGFTEEHRCNFGPYDRHYHSDAAWTWIRAHPLQAFTMSCDHVYDFFTGTVPWPTSNGNGTESHLATFWESLFFFVVLIPAGATGIRLLAHPWRRQAVTRADGLIAMPILGMMGVSFVFIGDPRYRVPFDGFLMIMAVRFYADVLAARIAMPDDVPTPVMDGAQAKIDEKGPEKQGCNGG